jgi:hypothetical protein
MDGENKQKIESESSAEELFELSKPGMSNMRSAGRMRPFASTPADRTKDTVIWSFNGQNCNFYNLNWINVRRSQKNCPMFFFIQNDFFTWKYYILFPSVKNILNKENVLCQACQTCGPRAACRVWPLWQHKCDPHGPRGTLGLTCLL